jgi:hypothetical protein
MSGQEFETALGEFLRWREMQPLNEKFRLLCGPSPTSEFGGAPDALAAGTARARLVIEQLHRSLYQEFGADRISAERAQNAYGALLDHLPNRESVVFVTTNYDPAIEIALEAMGHEVATGFRRRPGRTPVLLPEGTVNWKDNHQGRVPVLHLHGAVGWYEQDGQVVSQYADQAYNDSLGTPVVLYPDPEKDPTRDAIVQALWTEFDHALADATHVLVLGHSLHDPALVRKLAGINPGTTRLGVCVHMEVPDPEVAVAVRKTRTRELAAKKKQAQQKLKSAVGIGLSFGERLRVDGGAFESWLLPPGRKRRRTASS